MVAVVVLVVVLAWETVVLRQVLLVAGVAIAQATVPYSLHKEEEETTVVMVMVRVAALVAVWFLWQLDRTVHQVSLLLSRPVAEEHVNACRRVSRK
jgi:hypothetical protein